MRRSLLAVALALVLAGLELATQALSLAVARLGAGFEALLSGVDMHVSTARFVAGVLSLSLGAVLLLLLWWATGWRGSVDAVGYTCPKCGGRTRRVKRRRRHKLASALLGTKLTRRKCQECDWYGLSAAL